MTAYVSEQILFYFSIVHRKYFLYNYFLYFFLFSSDFSTSAELHFTVSFFETALQYNTFSSATVRKNFLNMNSPPFFLKKIKRKLFSPLLFVFIIYIFKSRPS